MDPRLVFGHDPGPFTGHGSNTWLLGGRVPTLIDAGSGAAAHLAALDAALEESGDQLIQVLVTHGHPDHAGGVAGVAVRHPAVTAAKYPWPETDGRWGARWRHLADEQVVEAGDTALWVVHTPGHAPDHVCFFEPRTATLFAGDLVMNGGTIVIPASQGGSLSQYLGSLNRILSLAPRRILAGHGPPIDQPASLVRAYIAHRLGREQQIVDVLRRGPATVAAIVGDVYPSLPDALVAGAGESVLAHLLKLEEEGRAIPDAEAGPIGPVWRLVE